MSRDLCIMACVFCRDPAFHAWINSLGPEVLGHVEITEERAKAFLTHLCGVPSRNDLDTNPAAAERFHDLVRLPFLAWKAEQTDTATKDHHENI